MSSSKNIFLKNLNFFGHRKRVHINLSNLGSDPTTIEEDYQITICQDGKFAVTFDTANLRIKILENTDHRSLNEKSENESEIISKTIAHFKINFNFSINKFYDTSIQEGDDDPVVGSSEIIENISNKKFEWSFDISNIKQHKNGVKYFIFVAVSRIDVDNDMKATGDNTKNDYKEGKKGKVEKTKFVKTNNERAQDESYNVDEETVAKGTVIYRLKLKKKENGDYDYDNITCYYSNKVSGICRFVNNTEQVELNHILKRFLVLNFYGIYNFEYDNCIKNFKLNDRINYPLSIKNELKYWYKETHCKNKLLAHLYDQYLLVEQYKNNVQELGVYDLADMKLKTATKRIERNDKHLREYNQNNFSVGKLQLCFTRGINSIKMYFLENGLETVRKKFDEIDKLYLLEFIDNDERLLILGTKGQEEKLKLIIWDPYNTGKVDELTLDDFPTIKNLGTRLARSSGNLLQVDDKGIVRSVLKKVENELTNVNVDQTNSIQNVGKVEPNNENTLLENDKDEITEETNENIQDNNDGEVNNELDLKNSHFQEPWVIGDYERNSHYLYRTETETLQLTVGRSTIQIWHQIYNKEKDDLPNEGQPFLEYIWANGIPVNQEREDTRLRINVEELKLLDDGGDGAVHLKVYWYERIINEKRKIKSEEDEEKLKNEENEEIKEIEANGKNPSKMVIKKEEIIIIQFQQKGINEKVNAVRHACEALQHFNKRKIFLANNYVRTHRYETIVMYIEHIIWRFVKHQPEKYKLLDVRHNVMKNLVLGNCNHLIKFILFGEEDKVKIGEGNEIKEDKENDDEVIETRHIHIPRCKPWPKKEDKNDLNCDKKKNSILNREKSENCMELAIYHCNGHELKDSIIVAYLLEYYSRYAKDDAGWMCTVSEALPLLYKYNYDDYAKKLFHKECFMHQENFSAQDPNEIIPEEYQASRKLNAFKSPNLRSYNLKDKINYFLGNLKNKDDEDLRLPPLILRVVPLPNFIVNKIPPNKIDKILKIENHFILKVLWLLFIQIIPRWYTIGQNQYHLLSPFSEAVQYENNDDMYDNPATEAAIDFRWFKTRHFFFFLFLRFIIFAICFILVSWAYLNHDTIIINEDFLFALIFIFYYLAVYLLVTELIQVIHMGFGKYLDIFNFFDVVAVVIPMFTMSRMLLSNGVESVGAELMAEISISIFILWIEAILHLRIISYIAVYIYYVIIIFKTVFPFLLFILVVIIAFAHAIFVLLKDPKNANIHTKNNTLSGNAINTVTNETLSITLQTDFNSSDHNDNPFSDYFTAIEAAFYWLSGNMVQRDHFDFWVIDTFTLIASVFLTIVLQNLLIAFMSGVYEEVATKGKQALLRYRANKIADYEALYQFHFWPQESEPKYVYYTGDWYKSIRKCDKDAIYKDFEEQPEFTKYAFKESDYDELSIWKYENTNNLIQKDNKKDKSPEATVSEGSEDKKGKFVDNKGVKDQKAIEKKIQEIKQMRDNLNDMIERLLELNQES